MKVLVAQSCLTLCDPMDYSPPGSSCLWNSPGNNTGVGGHSLLQGILLTERWSPALQEISLRIVTHQVSLSMGFSRQEYQSEQPFPSQRIFPSWGLNLGLLNCRQIFKLSESPGKPLYLYIYVCVHIYVVKSLQSCLTLCDPMDCSPTGFSVNGILQARIVEWVAISFSRGMCVYMYMYRKREKGHHLPPCL